MEKTYLAITRKYRPQMFGTVEGQSAVVTTLKNALKFKRIAHAYLFSGSRGTGKTTLARVFAKALNCENNADLEPCGECLSCKEIASGRCLDVLEIDGASHRGIDDIRQINETVGYATASGRYKIFIIDEAHMLTKEAFNALLKTLEEPPANVKFFLCTTEPYKLPTTIISRCQRFDLKRLSADTIFTKLSRILQDLGVEAESEAIRMLSQAADGSLRDAESLLEQLLCYSEKGLTAKEVYSLLGLSSRELFFDLDSAIKDNQPSFAFTLAEKVFSSGKEIEHFLSELIQHYRLLLLQKIEPQNPSLLVLSTDDQKEYATRASWYTKEQCLYYLDFLLQKEEALSRTTYKKVFLEMILLHVIQNKHRISAEQIIKKILLLESSLGKAPELPSMQEKEVVPMSQTPVLDKKVEIVEKVEVAPKKEAAPVPQKIEAPQRQEESKNLFTPQESKAEVQAAPVKIQEPKAQFDAPKTEAPPKPEPVKNSITETTKYDNLMRFAAVEFEGVLSKDSAKKI